MASYTKTTWTAGDLVTAKEMNDIETAIYDLYNTNISARIVPQYKDSDKRWVIVPHTNITSTSSVTSPDYVDGNGYAILTSGGEALAEFIGTANNTNSRATMAAARGSYTNRISAMVDSSGNCTYGISDKAAFREAIYAAATIEIDEASWSNVHNNLSSLTINEVSTVYMSSAVMKLISGNAIQTKFMGIVQRFDTSNYDFFGCGDVYGNNTEAYVFRLTGVNTSGGTFAQAKKVTFSTSV